MKLTKAEYRLLDALNDVKHGWPSNWLKPSQMSMVNRMRQRGLISKRSLSKGIVTMTETGRRSHSYGPR